MTKRAHGNKARLTITVDPAVVRAGNRAVSAGRAASLSAWVNVALMEQAARDARIIALGEAVEAYEATHGKISAEEIAEQQRRDRHAVRARRRKSA